MAIPARYLLFCGEEGFEDLSSSFGERPLRCLQRQFAVRDRHAVRLRTSNGDRSFAAARMNGVFKNVPKDLFNSMYVDLADSILTASGFHKRDLVVGAKAG